MGFWEITTTKRFDAERVTLAPNGQYVAVRAIHRPNLPAGLMLVTETRWRWNNPLDISVDGGTLHITGNGLKDDGHGKGGLQLRTYRAESLTTIWSSPYHHTLVISFGGASDSLEVVHVPNVS